MKKLAIIGASGHGKVVADLAQLLGYSVDFFDDAWPTLNTNSRWPVVGDTKTFLQQKNTYAGAAVAIGNNAIRKKIIEQLQTEQVALPLLVHPNAVVSAFAQLGAGTVVFANVAVNVDAHIGQGVILNTGCTVDHDCRIADFAHISPGAHLAGEVAVGVQSWVGIGASVKQQINIGEQALVGVGAVVVADVPAGAVVVGNPAKPLEKK